MLDKEQFIDFILSGATEEKRTSTAEAESALPEGFEGFGFDTEEPVVASESDASATFAQRLLEASGFGLAELVQRDNVIRGNDAVRKHLPARVSYWPKTTNRSYQTLLFETELTDKKILSIPAFKGRKMSHLGDVESALARLVSEALEGFQHGGERVTADVRQGKKEETLCVVSILDKREGEPVRLVCFGTQNKVTAGLETFHLTEQTRFWEPQLAREHLALLYERQFKKLESPDWQEAFTTTEERKQAEKLLEICTGEAPTEKDIQESVLNLLDLIAKGFGLRKKPKTERRLQAYALPPDHDIGIDPEERQSKHGGRNPFGGVALRDERKRLLGYIIYPLKSTSDAARLRQYLEKHNRFHNVLVIYPGEEQASLELWQGKEQLNGKLRKGQGYKDAAEVVNLLSRFFVVSKAKVRNPAELAQELAFRARYLRRLAIRQLEDEPEEGHLRDLYNAFKEALVHDQTEEEFADAYAQTLTYGLFSARWVSKDEYAFSGERFTRESALEHMPATSPFLRKFFQTVLQVSLDFKLTWLLDDIADLLYRINIENIFEQTSGNSTSIATDPVIHFYEPFLAAYDAKMREKRGVYYTPEPVVSYIVRSIDYILKTEFDLPEGLADKSKITIQNPDGTKEKVHRVQILDPATGTGTFLHKVIQTIHESFTGNKKEWQEYIHSDLLPRIHGFELLMAPYAVAHMKLGLQLVNSGYKFKKDERLNIYMTNTLEEGSGSSESLPFTEWLVEEAEAANKVKTKQPIMVVLGNPPYSYESENTGEWITSLVKDYYQIDGKSLGEHNPKGLQDDYVKFMRFAQWRIAQTSYGIFAFINNHNYIDGPTFRGMRQNFMNTFNSIYVLDLHGNTKKKECCPDGSDDKNVFDIQQGVAIGLFTKNQGKKENSQVYYSELWGMREIYSKAQHSFSLSGGKYWWLRNHDLSNTSWEHLSPKSPFYLFIPQNTTLLSEYESGWKITDIMPLYSVGIVTSRDKLSVHMTAEEAESVLTQFVSLPAEEARQLFNLGKDSRDWQVALAQADLKETNLEKEYLIPLFYRPFDVRFTYYTGHSRGFHSMPRPAVMKQMLHENVALLTSRMTKGEQFAHVGVTQHISEKILMSPKTSNNSFHFPLYLYSVDGGPYKRAAAISEYKKLVRGSIEIEAKDVPHEQQRIAELITQLFPQKNYPSWPNISPFFIILIVDKTKLNFTPNQQGDLKKDFGTNDIFHYIYSILHSPLYRRRYTEFLRLDFPRIPLPSNSSLFRFLCNLGEELVHLHLMRASLLKKTIVSFCDKGGRKIEKVGEAKRTLANIRNGFGRLYINPKSYFDGIPLAVWNFLVGGYQVCYKWLDDRKKAKRSLSDKDIEHYQKIIVAINETIRIMGEIDEVIEEHGGWPDAFVTKDD